MTWGALGPFQGWRAPLACLGAGGGEPSIYSPYTLCTGSVSECGDIGGNCVLPVLFRDSGERVHSEPIQGCRFFPVCLWADAGEHSALFFEHTFFARQARQGVLYRPQPRLLRER